MMRSSNPAFLNMKSAPASANTGKMTLTGTLQRAAFLLLLVAGAAVWSWTFSPGIISASTTLGAIAGLVIALFTVFRPHWASITAPMYAVAEGVFVGGLTRIMEAQYPGIAVNALTGTLAVFLVMLGVYKSGLIVVTDRFRAVMSIMLISVLVLYLASFVLSFFDVFLPMIHSGGVMGIGFSLFVIGLAAFTLLLDFDMIETAEKRGMPNWFEWYGAFSLTVTIVWLYVEVLRLLGKLRGE